MGRYEVAKNKPSEKKKDQPVKNDPRTHLCLTTPSGYTLYVPPGAVSTHFADPNIAADFKLEIKVPAEAARIIVDEMRSLRSPRTTANTGPR